MRQRMGKWTRVAAMLASLAAPAHAVADVTLYLGLTSGSTIAYTTSAPGGTWTRLAAADLPPVYYDALPALADLDGDGTADALVGDRNGVVHAFRNGGSDALPRWDPMREWDPPVDFDYGAAPALGDLDGDGDADLLVGRLGGDVVALENVGGRTPAWRTRPEWAIGTLGYDARPALADLDGDGRTDVLVGTRTGAVFAFSGPPFTRRPEWDPPRVAERVAPGLHDVAGNRSQDGRRRTRAGGRRAWPS
jgi:hypothetical protein